MPRKSKTTSGRRILVGWKYLVRFKNIAAFGVRKTIVLVEDHGLDVHLLPRFGNKVTKGHGQVVESGYRCVGETQRWPRQQFEDVKRS